MCRVKAKSPALHTPGMSEEVRRIYLKAMCEHAGRANLEGRAAIKYLSLCDPDLCTAPAPELLNAMELVDVSDLAVMHAA